MTVDAVRIGRGQTALKKKFVPTRNKQKTNAVTITVDAVKRGRQTKLEKKKKVSIHTY